jgi:hypothetical protein
MSAAGMEGSLVDRGQNIQRMKIVFIGSRKQTNARRCLIAARRGQQRKDALGPIMARFSLL